MYRIMYQGSSDLDPGPGRLVLATHPPNPARFRFVVMFVAVESVRNHGHMARMERVPLFRFFFWNVVVLWWEDTLAPV